MDESTLFKIVEEATGADAGSVSLDTTSADIEGWDSLGHLTIIVINEHLAMMLKRTLDLHPRQRQGLVDILSNLSSKMKFSKSKQH